MSKLVVLLQAVSIPKCGANSCDKHDMDDSFSIFFRRNKFNNNLTIRQNSISDSFSDLFRQV